MFAVIKTGGKQYKVAKDTILEVEKLEAEEGDTVNFEEVLMLGGDSPMIGTPLIDGAAVSAEVISQKRGDKVINYVKRRRKHSSQRRKGHRQYLTVVKITEIIASGGAKPAKKAVAKKDDAKAADTKAAAKVDAKATAKADTKVAAKADAKKADDKAADKATAKKADATDKAADKKSSSKKAASKADTAASAGEFKAPANLLKAANGEPDDLTRISGIGPVLIEKLHNLGVYHFSQIAEWTADDVAYVDNFLSFKGRIDRDEWIKQAIEFAKETK